MAAAATQGLRIGGRSGRVVAGVLQAAAAELAGRGYANFRIEAVASAAGVNKTTVYRRWPTKGDLVCAALLEAVAHTRQGPDTGSLQGDLVEMLRRDVAWKQTAAAANIFRMLMLEAAEPGVERVTRILREAAFQPWLAIVTRGKERGELPARADARLFVEMVVSPTMVRRHRLKEPINDATLGLIVRTVIAGTRATTAK